MKTRMFSIMLIALLFAFFINLSAEYQNVKYITGYVKDVDDNIITLTNNIAFKADQHVTAISMTPVVFILHTDRLEGFVYINNERIEVTLMRNAGNGYYLPATSQDLENYNNGKLEIIKTLYTDEGRIELVNEDEWKMSDKEETELLSDWEEGDSVIVVDVPDSETKRLINTRTTDHARFSKTHKAKTTE